MRLPITVQAGRKVAQTEALIDCGAGGEFVSQRFAQENGLELLPLKRPIKAKNVDGTPNKQGTISHYTRIKIRAGDREEPITLLVTGLGKRVPYLGASLAPEE